MLTNVAFTPGHMLLDTSCIHLDTSCVHLHPLVAVNIFLVSVTILLPVCRSSVAGYKGIQVDAWHKWIVIMSPVAEIQSTCIPNEQLVSGDMYPSINAVPSNEDRAVASTVQMPPPKWKQSVWMTYSHYNYVVLRRSWCIIASIQYRY